MPEAIIRRFRGIAFGLPEIRNSEYAADALNVYEKQPGALTRREGTRRAIEYKDEWPVKMIAQFVQPGGEYTGIGLDLLLQGEQLRGEAPPKPAVSGYAPSIASVSPTSLRYSDVGYAVHIYGGNLDSWNLRPIQIEFIFNYGKALETSRASRLIEYHTPGHISAELPFGLQPGQYAAVRITNPDGQTAVLEDALSVTY